MVYDSPLEVLEVNNLAFDLKRVKFVTKLALQTVPVVGRWLIRN